MIPARSKARTRRRQGGADMPARSASSTLVMRPFDCRSLRMRRSIRSSFARAIRFSSRWPRSMPEPCHARNKVARFGQPTVHNCARLAELSCIPGEVCIYVEDMRLAGCERDMAATHRSKVLILGSGPAGYTAAIYAARASLKPMLVQGIQPGGQLTITTDVENYPGFADVIQGPWLMEQMEKQAAHVGTKIVTDLVTKLELARRPFRLTCDSGDLYLAETVILATGAQARWLRTPSEEKFKGFGVSACATCDGFFYRGKQVIVVGGGNTAVEEALFLTNFASQVTIVHRRDQFRAERILQERLFRHPKINVIWDSAIDEICGTENPGKVTHVRLKNVKTGALTELPAEGGFIAIGHAPATELILGQLKLKPSGYVEVAPNSTATSVPGVFAAGDVADETYRQAVTAAGLGCMAALEAERFLALRASDRAAAE